ncbi:hypothetical protein ACM42_16735 [Bradyrhizobium sp. CCBAU 25338]|nr:hypothetical protein [Bradyrhizobium sp. CCBAU 25338]
MGWCSIWCCAFLDVTNNDVGSFAFGVQLQPGSIGTSAKLILRAVAPRADGQVMESGGGLRTIPEELHVANDALDVGSGAIADLEHLDRFVLGLEKMLDQLRAVPARSPMFGDRYDHRLSGL